MDPLQLAVGCAAAGPARTIPAIATNRTALPTLRDGFTRTGTSADVRCMAGPLHPAAGSGVRTPRAAVHAIRALWREKGSDAGGERSAAPPLRETATAPSSD